MSPFRKSASIAYAVAAVSIFAVAPSQAFMGECSIALNNKAFEEKADKPQITVQDTVEHQPLTIDFQGKTLRTIKPGDTVQAHGEPHVLLEVEQRANYSRYTFASEDDVARYHAALSGESVEQHVGVQGDGVEHGNGVEHGGSGSHK